MAKYKIWDRESDIVTPVGRIYTAKQWIEKHPIAGITKTVVKDSEINGAIFEIFSAMVERAAVAGADFSACKTDQDYLDVIEEMEMAEREAAAAFVSAEERIAAALEYQAMASLPDEEE